MGGVSRQRVRRRNNQGLGLSRSPPGQHLSKYGSIMNCGLEIMEYRLDILGNILAGIGGASAGMVIAYLIVIYLNHRKP